MKSIRSKFTLLMVLAVVVSILAVGITSIVSIKMEEDASAGDQMLLLCQTEQLQLDAYLNSIEQSVQTVFRFAQEDLNSKDSDDILENHLDRVDGIFHSIAENTNGALTYYYRISPEVSETEKGFFFVRKGQSAFSPLALADLTKYDPHDISHVGWYTIPRERGVPSWLDPYYNANLGVRMLSYVAPLYRHGVFFGVIGMDFKYFSLVEQVRDIKIFDTGYAFLVNGDGEIVYHPTLATGTLLTTFGDELERDKRGHQEPIVKYSFNGEKKRTACAELSNGMLLYITAPESEINAGWVNLMSMVLGATAILLAGCVLVSTLLVNHITNPLRRLTEAARQVDAGDYDVKLDYKGSDEVGILTGAFHQLIDHLKSYIEDLNSRAYTDSLTSVRNKGAFSLYARKLQDRMELPGETPPEFAFGMFDCNDLKYINDKYGHDKGDMYLRTACLLICKVYQHSPVFRMGGDEFAVCLQGQDFRNREALAALFDRRTAEINAQAKEPWERVDIAKGFAVFEPGQDKTAEDVLRRADNEMYRDKRRMKEENGSARERGSV